MATTKMSFDIADCRLDFRHRPGAEMFGRDFLIGFNHRHASILDAYDLELESGQTIVISNKINSRSNLGALRNRQLRESVILAAGLSAVAVALCGRGSLQAIPPEKQTKNLIDELKRNNDRTAAQIMAEVLQTTTESLPVGEEVLIESVITEGVRAKPGKEPGGNPTIAVGALFGKKEHRMRYGLPMPEHVTLLSMGSDVIDGTTKSVKGLHSSFTALFLTESGVKRHLPDVYVQRWMAGVPFAEFNPREASLLDSAEIMINAYGLSRPDYLSSFFLDRKRHRPAMKILNDAGIVTPYDSDGDLFPAVVLGLDGLQFPDGRRFLAMIGEIGGSAEWAVGVLPLVWRGGQALGMLTSQSSLTRDDLAPEELWRQRFHFTEDELILIQDARFEQKPYFTIHDILERPFAGGISAFGSITDNYYLPFMKGVDVDFNSGRIGVNVLVVNSLGIMECWQMTFRARQSILFTKDKMRSPKVELTDKTGSAMQQKVAAFLEDPCQAARFRLFLANEYYPALVLIRDRLVVLDKVVATLIERQAWTQKDKEIIQVTQQLARDWFAGYE